MYAYMRICVRMCVCVCVPSDYAVIMNGQSGARAHTPAACAKLINEHGAQYSAIAIDNILHEQVAVLTNVLLSFC